MRSPVVMVEESAALAGRSEPMVIDRPHLVLGRALSDEPVGYEVAYVAMGCFWGAERVFYRLPGVWVTAVGYQGGYTPNPTYEEVCTGRTGHAEVVKVVFDPAQVSYEEILCVFFENHDPTQGFRQGADIGTQYRSAVFTADDRQATIARDVTVRYGRALAERGYGEVTTEIAPAKTFFLAEEYHQQYLEANPRGYCGIGGTGVSCPVGLDLD